MQEQLKNVKIYWLFFAASVCSLLYVLFIQGDISNKYPVSWGIVLSTCFFFLSCLSYKFNNVKEEHKTYTSNDKMHFVLMLAFFVISLVYLISKEPGVDDLHFQKTLDDKTLFQLIELRYTKWSSRCILESVLVPLSIVPVFIWRLLTALVFSAIAESIITIAIPNDRKNYSIIVYLLLALSIPEQMLCDAGWIATTLNYVWPLAAFLVSMVTLKKIFTGEATSLYEKCQLVPLTIFASNMEILSIAYLGILFTLAAYQIVIEKVSLNSWVKNIDKAFFVMFAAALVVFIFDMTAPGNAERAVNEASNAFPEYLGLNLIDKVVLGFISTLPFLYAGGYSYPINFCMVILTLILCLVLWKNKNWKMLLLQIPGMAVLLVNHLYVVTGHSIWFFSNNLLPQFSHYPARYVYIEILIYVLIFIALLLGIYHAFANNKKALLACTIVLMGYCCRFALGFSPTAYVSRPFLFTIVAILVTATLLIIEYLNTENTSWKSLAIIFGCLFVYTLAIDFNSFFRINQKIDINVVSETVNSEKISNLPESKVSRGLFEPGFNIDSNNGEIVNGKRELTPNEDGLKLVGWAFDAITKEPLNNLYAKVGDKYFKASYGGFREDVAQVFNVSSKVSFCFNIPAENLKKDNGQIETEILFLLQQTGKDSLYAPISVKINGADPSKLESRPFKNTEWNCGLHIESCNNVNLPEGSMYLQADKQIGLLLSGWAIDTENKTNIGGIVVTVGDTSINATYGINRKDVADFFKMNEEGLGFTVEIPANVLNNRKDVNEVNFVIIPKTNDFKYEPIVYSLKK